MTRELDELCPMCKKHRAIIDTHMATTIISELTVQYEETVYFCSFLGEDDPDAYFETPEIMNQNLANARAAYEAHCV